MAAVHLVILLLLTYVTLGSAQNTGTGRFWHVTDFHYDHSYWTRGLSCNDVVNNPGKYGDYWCDSPWLLVQDSIANMAHIAKDVDFIIWTGDNVAHIKDEDLSLDINIEILQNITSALSENLPDVPVYASLGNHDFWPSDQAQPIEDEIYRRVADMWEEWIGNQSQVELFKGGGYYSAMPKPKIRLLALNTNLYYTSNNITGTNNDDPADQLQWMTTQFERARSNEEKVIVTGHVPAGLLTPGLADWFYPQYKSKFVDILTRFSDVIVGTHFGHDHSDGFKILQTSDGSKAVTQYTAPSVTPWRYKLVLPEGNQTGKPHNPGIRLVEYDRETGRHLNYHQYYINLTESNTNGQANWIKLYSFKEDYNVDDMSVSSLRQIFSRMENGGGKELAYKYCKYALVSAHDKTCTDEMRAEIYCGGLHYNLEDAKSCKEKYIKSINGAVSHYRNSYIVMSAVIALGYVMLMVQV